MWSQAKEYIPRATEAGRHKEGPSKEDSAANTLISDFWPSELKENPLPLF